MHEFEPEFDKYLDQILSPLKIDRKEKRQLKQEWSQHLFDILDNLTESGIQRNEAINMAIKQFGAPELLKLEVTQIYESTRRQHLLKELAVWIVCLIAASIGPYILIKARFSIGFILTSAVALLFYYFIYHKVIKVVPDLITYFALLPIYTFWVYLFLKLGNEVSFEHYLTNLFTLDWSRLTGVDGLFRFPTLHMLWYTIIFINVFAHRNKTIMRLVVVSSFRYWSLLTVGFILARMAPSSEASVIVLNVALLYAFLQQVITTIRAKDRPSMAVS